MAKLSATAFNKAASVAGSLSEQNQTMEIVNVDVVDMIEQILCFENPRVPKPRYNADQPKDVHDIQKLVSEAAFRLRVILELERK